SFSLVTLALCLGLKPAGFDTVSSFGADGGEASTALSSVLVTPALKRGLKPAGFDTVSSLDADGGGVSTALSSVLVTPALKRGLKPAGLFSCVATVELESAVGSNFSGSIGLVTLALNLGLKPKALLESPDVAIVCPGITVSIF